MQLRTNTLMHFQSLINYREIDLTLHYRRIHGHLKENDKNWGADGNDR